MKVVLISRNKCGQFAPAGPDAQTAARFRRRCHRRYVLTRKLLVLSTFWFVACNVIAEEFAGLTIPEENVLLASSPSLCCFDDGSADIALIVDEREMAAAIPKYKVLTKNPEMPFVLYANLIDLKRVSASVLADFDQGSVPVEDRWTNYKRLYRTPGSWVLVSGDIPPWELIAICRISGINSEFETCSYKTNIAKFGVIYSLRNSNNELRSNVEQYLIGKLREWAKST